MADNLSPAARSYCMSRVRSRDTNLEVLLRSALHRSGLRFRTHVRTLPGRPDIVLSSARVAIFVDGDFWHGFRFPAWESSLAPFWRQKIQRNRHRDQRNFRRLRRQGWIVVRIWQHQIESDLPRCVERVRLVARRRRSIVAVRTNPRLLSRVA
jgi:DNA mismatch endonuclease, patch repair protein